MIDSSRSNAIGAARLARQQEQRKTVRPARHRKTKPRVAQAEAVQIAAKSPDQVRMDIEMDRQPPQ
ncbi:hypothetical protein [Erythrobacter sp. MTPC3]|uniref:hypothetical protein n=1 Tax=Erythrobacter sp. MTPC3 TaxID=3056564 RepID=UPI0036F42938